jgi:hypothetical protein
MRYILQLLFLSVFNGLNCYSQSFIKWRFGRNCNSLVTILCLVDWLNVPYWADPNCLCDHKMGNDTPDLTKSNLGPDSTSGMRMEIPIAGNSVCKWNAIGGNAI